MNPSRAVRDGAAGATGWSALGIGLVGGALAGALDGLVALALAPATGGKTAAGLPLAAAGTLALLGGGTAVAFSALTQGAARLAATRVTFRRWAPQVLAALVLTAPVALYDGFALLAGPRVRGLPGRPLLSLLAAVLMLAGVGLFGNVVRRLTAASRTAGRRLILVLAMLVVVAGLFGVNRVVLPRLYPWFHATLALAIGALMITAAAVALADRRFGRGRAVTLTVAALAASLGGAQLVAGSQTSLFLAYERTQLYGPVVAALPAPIPVRPGMRARGGRVTRVADPRDKVPLADGPRRPGADVVLITVDALRADHVGAYGYRRNTTPHIDALARRGARFERAYTQAPNTSFASTSMLTGKYYPTLARLRAPDGQDTLPLLLRRYGVKTAAFYPPAVFYVEPEKLAAYRDSNFHFEYVKIEFLDAHARLSQLAEFFASEKIPRAFLWVHFFEPHEPYDKWPGHDFGSGDLDRYDSEIAYVDAAIGRLVANLERERPGTIFIVTADHGEEFDEHGSRYHGTTLYEEQLRVPLVIAVPGVQPRVVEGPVELVDLAPTILGLLDIPIPVRMRGTDLGPWLASPPAPADRLPPAFAEVGDHRMVATATEKLICNEKNGFCALYDLAADPGERKNVADARPARVAALRAELDAWLGESAELESQVGQGDGSVVPPAIERGRMGDPGAAVPLAALMSSSEPLPVRREAARLLVTSVAARPETQAAVAQARSSEDAEIRGWAIVAAARLKDPAALAELGRELAARPTAGSGDAAAPAPALRQLHAALALAAADDARAVPTLAAALPACTDVASCQQITRALGRSRAPAAVAALLARLPTVIGRRDVVAALGEIGDSSATSALAERLSDDEYVSVRAEAAASLARIGGPPAAAALERAARRESEPDVLQAIAQARRRLAESPARPGARP